MKIRSSFIANSSTSCFIFIRTKEKLTKELILMKLRTDETHPLRKIAEEIADITLGGLENTKPIEKDGFNVYKHDYMFSEEDFERFLKYISFKDEDFEIEYAEI